MKIICAPDSFKETLSARHVAIAMARGIQLAAQELQRRIEIDVCPVGDGGEGTMEALVEAQSGEVLTAEVLDPLGQPISAEFAIVKSLCSHLLQNETLVAGSVKRPTTWGVVELARASGLALVPPARRNPMNTTTFGTGQLIRSAIKRGCDGIIVCIGGSATVDGGAGIAQAVGAKFFDSDDHVISEPITGGMLSRVARVMPPSNLPMILVACDVTNPLCGPNGAAHVYGPQKGATAEQVNVLDESLAKFAAIAGGDPNTPGAGAAGGAGFGLAALCSAKLVRGVDLVLDAVGFAQRCKVASLALTGEGRLDGQSLHGKACMGVAQTAESRGVPAIAIVGSTGDGADQCLLSHGGFLQSYVSLAQRFGTEHAMRDPATLIERTTHDVIREFLELQ